MSFKLASIVTVIILFFMTLPTHAQISGGDDTVWTKNLYPVNVKNVHFSKDGSKFFVSTTSGTVYVYNTLTGDSVYAIKGVGDVRAFTSDGKYAFTTGLQKVDLETYQIVGAIDTIPSTQGASVYDIALTGDENYFLVTLNTPINQTPPMHDNIVIFSAGNMKFQKMLKSTDWMEYIVTSPDGKYFVTSNYFYDTVKMKETYKRLVLWDAKKFEQIKIIKSYDPNKNEGYGQFKFTPDSKYFAVFEKQIVFFNTKDFNKNSELNTGSTPFFYFTNDVNFLITSGLKMNIWDLATNKIIHSYYVYDTINDIYYSTGETGIDVTHDRKYIISTAGYFMSMLKGRFDETAINDHDNERIIRIYPNPTNGIVEIAFSSEIPGHYSVDIYNESGILVQNLYSGLLNSEEHKFIWNTINQADGTYLSKITGNGFNLTYKIIIVR